MHRLIVVQKNTPWRKCVPKLVTSENRTAVQKVSSHTSKKVGGLLLPTDDSLIRCEVVYTHDELLRRSGIVLVEDKSLTRSITIGKRRLYIVENEDILGFEGEPAT